MIMLEFLNFDYAADGDLLWVSFLNHGGDKRILSLIVKCESCSSSIAIVVINECHSSNFLKQKGNMLK